MLPGGDIIVACALKKELLGLRRRLGGEVRFVATGMGTDRTLRTLEELFERAKPSLLLFTGMAGQLDPSIGLGDFVFPEVWGFESGTEFSLVPGLTAELRAEGWKVEGKGLTVRSPVVKRRSRLQLHRATGALICDMESAAAMMISTSYGVPCLAPKIVSDTAESGMLAFYRHFDHNLELLAQRIGDLLETMGSFSV